MGLMQGANFLATKPDQDWTVSSIAGRYICASSYLCRSHLHPSQRGIDCRQRSSHARETAHPFFYKVMDQVLAPKSGVKPRKKYREVEEICDRTAKRTVVPMRLLRTQVQATPGESKRIDVSFVRKRASRFKTSDKLLGPCHRCVRRSHEVRGDQTYFAVMRAATPPEYPLLFVQSLI